MRIKFNLKQFKKIMEKNVIEVPYGIRYLSDWKEFSLSNFPSKCIINKQIPGCGFTEFCLMGPDDLILCSPRIMLIKNKEDQHKGEVYVVHNNMERDLGVDKDLNKDSKDSKPIENLTEEEIKERNKEIYKKLFTEISEYINFRRSQNLPCKIIVTYDSYHVVLSILQKLDIMYRFKTVVDEFQSILHDARFKSGTEISFLDNLKQSPTAYFVSATPMLDDYLEMLEDFKDLPYFDLDWETLQPGRIIRPDLKVLFMKSSIKKACEVIQKYKDEDFEIAYIPQPDGSIKEVVSDEAVLYLNSVNHIISVIKKMDLKPEEVNILCSNTEENRKKIKSRLGKDWDIGKVPLKGEKHKKYSFCTRTAYLGADFYSLCARSFVFSDSNIDCMAVDIAEDLPQILGRQRLIENPWKNCLTLYYRTVTKDIPQEEFESVLKKKIKDTKNLIDAFYQLNSSIQETLANSYVDLIKMKNYRDDYVAVNKVRDKFTGRYNLVPVFNNLVYINEVRSYRIAQIDYKDRVSVFSSIVSKFGKIDNEVESILDEYSNATTCVDKLKVLCEHPIDSEVLEVVLAGIPDSDRMKTYFLMFGPEKIKATWYNLSFLKTEFEKRTYNNINLYIDIFNNPNFSIGVRIECSTIKEIFREIYTKNNSPFSPKATDLKDYFEVKEVLIPVVDENGKKKRAKGYEILGVNVNSKYYKEYVSFF